MYLRGVDTRFRCILYKLLYKRCRLSKQHYINILHFISTSVYMIISTFVYMIIYIYCNISNIVIYIKLELRWSGLRSIKSVMRRRWTVMMMATQSNHRPKKGQLYVSVVTSCLDSGLFLRSSLHHFSASNYRRRTSLSING